MPVQQSLGLAARHHVGDWLVNGVDEQVFVQDLVEDQLLEQPLGIVP